MLRNANRAVSVLLVLVMVLGLIPVSALAAETPAASVYKNGVLQGSYADVQSAIRNCDGGVIVLEKNVTEDITLNGDLYLNLNGKTLTGNVSGNGTLYGMDSANDTYDAANCGRITGTVSCAVANHFTLDENAKRYVAVADQNGYTFHRIYVGITKQSLAPSVTGIGYKAEFYADETVLAMVDTIGYDLWLENGNPISRSASFQNALTLRVKNFDVANYSQTKLYASVWMTVNGETISSSEYSLTFRQVLEAVNASWTSYNQTQKTLVREMVNANLPFVRDWNIAWILADESKPETAENDWTNLAVDGGMSNASYAISTEKTAPGSSKSMKITTRTGDVGCVYLNATSKPADFTNGKVTAWFYFGDQRPMAFLRGIDSNWNKGLTGIFTLEDMGNGWYYGWAAASDLGFEVDAANTNPAEMIRVAVEIPGGYTAYVDNLKWEAVSVTEETEKANDLFALSTVVAEHSTITPEITTEKVAGITSLYSHKFTAKAGVAEKKTVRYALPKSYDLTQQALSLDIHRYGVSSLVTMEVSLQNSQGNTVDNVYMDNIYWLDWNHIEVDLYKYLEAGQSLADVKYITFTFFFDADTSMDREIYLDNLTITPYETVDTALKGASALYVGDSISISKPFKGWAGLLEERYGVDRTNVSVGGTTFSNIGYQIKEQLKNVPEDAEFDYILLDGGCNDMYLGASSFGTVSDLPVTAAPSSFDDSTAIGGFEQLLSMLKRRFPTAKIGYIITYQRSDKWLNEFIPLAKAVCEKWGVSCLSLPETDPFIQLFNSNSGAHTTDTVHSNVAGYELIMEFLPQWMESIPEPEIIEGFEPEKPIEVFEGGAFAAGENATFNLNHTQPVTKMSFEYKITSGDNFYLALLPDWSSYYGYFQFNATGTIGAYDGVTTEVLSDGYVRVTVDVENITAVTGAPSKLITMLFIRGDWGNAAGEIRDIRVNGAVEVPGPGIDFAAGVNAQINFEEGTYDFASFDYEFTSGGEMAFGLLKSDWSKFYGLFKVNANGTIQDYEGISVEKLSNGKMRVTLDLSKVQVTNNAGNRDNVPDTIGMLFIRGDWTTASGAISNLRCWNGEAGGDEGGNDENYTEIVTPGGSFAANEGITVNFEAGAYDVVTFDYQITNGGEMQVCLLSSDWAKYYGYFKFNTNGLVQDYEGVSTEKLSNGYIRVTLKLADLGVTNWQDNRDNAPETVGILYVRGNISSAAGSVDNIRCITGNYVDDEDEDSGYTEIVTPGAAFTSGTNQSIYLTEGAYDMVTFDYKFSSGTKMYVALLQADWAKYYGYIKLDADGVSGSYDGVTFEKLDNGYIRVTMELAKITVTNNAYNADNAPDTIAQLFVRGDWSDANGTIDNIRCLTKIGNGG